MQSSLYAVTEDGSVRKVSLSNELATKTGEIFRNAGMVLLNDSKQEVLFDGNYVVEDDEVLYVEMDIDSHGKFKDAVTNPLGIRSFNIKEEKIKALFWYEVETYFFQNFDSRKLLRNRFVLYQNSEVFNELTSDAMIIDRSVHAIHRNGRFYFVNFPNANKVINLSAYYREATDADIDAYFDSNSTITCDTTWMKEKSNTVIRKYVTLLEKSRVLDGANTGAIKKKARRFKIDIELDKKGRIVLPDNIGKCREMLKFLNEQHYKGPITGKHYIASSKRSAN